MKNWKIEIEQEIILGNQMYDHAEQHGTIPSATIQTGRAQIDGLRIEMSKLPPDAMAILAGRKRPNHKTALIMHKIVMDLRKAQSARKAYYANINKNND